MVVLCALLRICLVTVIILVTIFCSNLMGTSSKSFSRWLGKMVYHRLVDFLRYFSQNSLIHGLQFVGNTNISKPERILWLLIVLAAFAYSHYSIKLNFEHYWANPTVVTIKKDFRNWENPFPAVTACYVNKVDSEKAEKYIQLKWGVSPEEDKYSYYLDFVNIVSNLTYKTLHTLQRFKNDKSLHNINWLSLIKDVHPPLNGVLITFRSKVRTEWQFVITELGLCLTLNSKFAELLSPNITSAKSFNNLKTMSEWQHLKCHYLNGLCYARYDSDPNMPLEYHIHSHLEVIHATSEEPLLVKKSEEYEINYKLTEVYSLDDIRYLTPHQRKCRFDDEPLTKNVPVYGNSICSIECRYRLAIETCGCKPFFYHFLDGNECDINGLLCLSKISHLFNQSTRVFGCDCPQPCNLMVFLKQIPKVTEWDTGYFDQRITFRWGLVPPTTKYHRKIIFGFQELIVSLGGALSLFVGMSFISAVEGIYLIWEYNHKFLSERKNLTKVQIKSK